MSYKHSKSQLLQHDLHLLGTVVGRDGLAPDPSKIQGICDLPPPVSKSQLRELFGTLNWLRPFLGTRFGEASEGLRRYLKKSCPDEFELDADGLKSFEALKGLCADHIMLMGLHNSWHQGDLISIVLTFEKAGEMTLDVPVDLNRSDAAHSH